MTRYVMENPDEVRRLERKTDAESALAQLALVGLTPGMSVLDAGSGSGAVARAIGGAVGPAGRVVALDASAARSSAGAALARMRSHSHENVAFVVGDVHTPPLREGTFDLVWSRFLFGYLEDPDHALARLAALLRPGGKVVVGEVDGHGMFHWPVPERVAEGLPRFEARLAEVFDPWAGRKLYHRFRRLGLADVRVHVLPYHLFTDSIAEEQLFNWRVKLKTLRPVGVKALGSEAAWDAFVRDYLGMLQDPDTLTYSVLFLVEGVRGA